MSEMAASNPELLLLIHGHLKEHGFHTAASELHKLIPQNEAPSSTTLLDIYTAWLKSEKRRKKSATAKSSTPTQKKTSPKKAPQRKKTDKTAKPGSKSGTLNKKSTPAKGKKSDGKMTKKVIKSSKPDVLKATGADNTDSDSSLDVEKWKKLVQEMTESDLVKLEAFNALTSPEPKKQRVRKPSAKSKAKTETPVKGQSEKSDKSVEDVLAKTSSTKKSRPKKAVATLKSSNKDEPLETPATSLISTLHQSPKKEKRKAPADQASLEPEQIKIAFQNQAGIMEKNVNNNNDSKIVSPMEKTQEKTPKKKKNKETTLNGTGDATDGDDLFDKNNSSKDAKIVSLTQIEFKEGNQESTFNIQPESKKKKKKKADKESTDGNVSITNTANTAEDVNLNMPVENLNSLIDTVNAEEDTFAKVKKKKKKKDKAKDDGDSQQAVTEANSVINEGTCETTVEETSPNTEALNKKKKKKNKSKDDEDSQQVIPVVVNIQINKETCETAVEEASPKTDVPKKKKKHKNDKNKGESETLHPMETNCLDEAKNTEQIVVKKKSEKFKKHSEEHLETKDKTPLTEGCEEPELPLDPPSTPQTPGPKKKKHKMDSEKIADAVPPTADDETPKKKKKKASKSSESQS